MKKWGFKKTHYVLGLMIGVLLTMGCLVFFLMYTSFVSLFQSLNLSHVYAAQLTRLKIISAYISLIRLCFYGALAVEVVYLIHALIGYHQSRHRIYIWTFIMGMVTIIVLISSIGFMMTLHNLSLFSRDISAVEVPILRNKYDYIYSLINHSAGFSSLLSRARNYIMTGFIGAAMVGLHLIYALEINGQVILESDDLKVPFSKIEKLLKADEKMDTKAKTHHPLFSDPKAKTIEFTSFKSVPHYYEKHPNFNFEYTKPKRSISFLQKTLVATLVCVAVVLSGMGVYTAYDKYFNFINIDLMRGVTFNYAGISGTGYITNFDSNLHYDTDDENIEDFIKKVTYSYDTRSNLSNGDEITITAKYSKKLAEQYHIHILRDTQSYKVSGLVYRFKNSDKIKKSVKSAIVSDADTAFKNYFNEQHPNNPGYSYEPDSYWFGKSSTDVGDYAIGVYKVTYTYNTKSVFSNDVVYYMYTYVGGVNSNYSYVKSSANYRTPDDRIYATSSLFDTQKILTALSKSFPDVKFSQIR